MEIDELAIKIDDIAITSDEIHIKMQGTPTEIYIYIYMKSQ